MPSKPRILFAGGGTWGHIAPLLAVMQAVGDRAHMIYVGSESDIASPVIAHSHLKFTRYSVSSGKLNRFITWKHFVEFGKIILGICQAVMLISKVRPQVVMAKGGQVSVPIVLAARMFGIPVCTHETDVVPGLANRITARFAKTIFTSFPTETYNVLPHGKLKCSGQPVREAFFNQKHVKKVELDGVSLKLDLPIVTITGGSQGARRINELIAAGWAELSEFCRVVHLCGPSDFKNLHHQSLVLTPKQHDRIILLPVVTEGMADLIATSTVVVSRSGGTLHELAAAGSPTILIPLPTAAQNHQWANAQILAQAGAAVLLDERVLTSAELVREIRALLLDGDRRARLSEAISHFARPEAAAIMADDLLTLAS